MEPADFKAAWEVDGDTLYSYPVAALSRPTVPESSRQFLAIAGLPTEAPPCLTFGATTLDWIPSDVSESYLPLGSDGSGNPIVLDGDGVVLVLDHERSFDPQYMNKDVATLAETLWLYRNIISEATVESELDEEIPAHLREKLIGFLSACDPHALQTNAPWASELLANR